MHQRRKTGAARTADCLGITILLARCVQRSLEGLPAIQRLTQKLSWIFLTKLAFTFTKFLFVQPYFLKYLVIRQFRRHKIGLRTLKAEDPMFSKPDLCPSCTAQ